jgi:transposase
MWRKYSVELKMEVVEVWREHRLTMAEIMSKYKISAQTVQRWATEYDSQGVDGLVTKPIKKIYTGEFKQKVVEDMRDNRLNQSETSRKYSVGRNQVQQWERIYLEKGPEGLYIENRGRTPKSVNTKKKAALAKNIEADLIAENQRLRMENEYLKKLNALIQAKEK